MKNFHKIMALVLVVALALTLTACKGKDDKNDGPVTIVGTWNGNIDMAKVLEQEIAGSGEGAEMAQYFDFSGLSLKLVAVFNEDGTFKLSADGADLASKLKPMMVDGMKKYMMEGAGYSEEDVKSYESMIESLVDEEVSEISDGAGFNYEGKYKLEGNKLYMVDASKDFTEDDACTVELSAKELKITEIKTTESDDGIDVMKSLLPLVFTK